MYDYNYNEATVRFYDVLYDQHTGILRNSHERAEFYLEEITKVNGAVLEAGVGTGMIFIPALKSGVDIYGIDKSPLMFEKVRSKLDASGHYRITLQDMRDFAVNKKFSLIISPFRVFQHLLSISDQMKALERVYDHLESGGRFIFDLFCP